MFKWSTKESFDFWSGMIWNDIGQYLWYTSKQAGKRRLPVQRGCVCPWLSGLCVWAKKNNQSFQLNSLSFPGIFHLSLSQEHKSLSLLLLAPQTDCEGATWGLQGFHFRITNLMTTWELPKVPHNPLMAVSTTVFKTNLAKCNTSNDVRLKFAATSNEECAIRRWQD